MGYQFLADFTLPYEKWDMAPLATPMATRCWRVMGLRCWTR